MLGGEEDAVEIMPLVGEEGAVKTIPLMGEEGAVEGALAHVVGLSTLLGGLPGVFPAAAGPVSYRDRGASVRSRTRFWMAAISSLFEVGAVLGSLGDRARILVEWGRCVLGF